MGGKLKRKGKEATEIVDSQGNGGCLRVGGGGIFKKKQGGERVQPRQRMNREEDKTENIDPKTTGGRGDCQAGGKFWGKNAMGGEKPRKPNERGRGRNPV